MEKIRPLKKNEWDELAYLIFTSTNTWYEVNGKSAVFNCAPSDLRFFCEVYEAMDPNCCLVIEIDGTIAASCFYHPRPTHFSLGIMCVHPDYYGRGLARLLLNEIIERAHKADKPLNLISSAMNLDSFSLYNKAGFIPKTFFQDMIIPVPEEGLNFSGKELSDCRKATFADIPAMVEVEKEIHGQDHGKDLQYIINDSTGVWNCYVFEKDNQIQGFLCSVNHASSKIIGLGAMKEHRSAAALIKSQLNHFKGENPLVIIPSKERELVQELLKLKARNVELHVSQTNSPDSAVPIKGLILPTFMPE